MHNIKLDYTEIKRAYKSQKRSGRDKGFSLNALEEDMVNMEGLPGGEQEKVTSLFHSSQFKIFML